MAYEIKPLTPALAETFSNYLTNLDFANTPHWASCFCRFYHSTCSQQEWMARSLETNRDEAVREIAAGNMRGYLVFEGETCVGWCNANDVQALARIYPDVEEYCRGKRVGCTICYVIHPEHRGRGVARKLLARAIEDFRQDGFDAMIALPIEAPNVKQRQYRGTLHMYQEAGFVELQAVDAMHIMWLDLK